MNTIFQNLENGNLTQAKKQAKSYPGEKLVDMAENDGYSRKDAINIAEYLKNLISFQTYCDNGIKMKIRIYSDV